MRVFSFIEEKKNLIPVEVELALWPGLPTIHFLGQADAHLKEASLRIKSAIKAAGFDFPVAQQIVVNLRPTHLRKSSRGIELAVAAAYLWMTGQVQPPVLDSDFSIYGELSLFGEVTAPEDLVYLKENSSLTVLTGEFAGMGERPVGFRRWVAKDLRALTKPEHRPANFVQERAERPALPGLSFTEHEAQLLEILALGGHHVLLAGPAGSGKSTLARALQALMSEPNPAELDEIRKLNPDYKWRPMIEPHHSTPRMAMIGGASPPLPGEIARAHRGLLLLDEFLEFDRHVLESLREPFEQGLLRVGRLGGVETFQANSQIVATTNLCPCGRFMPGEMPAPRCRFTIGRCRSYSARLSGPLLDRFHLVYFPKRENRRRDVELASILANVEKTRGFRSSVKLNRELKYEELVALAHPSAIEIGLSQRQSSQRRTLATLRVARSIADLRGSEKIKIEDMDQALEWAITPFDQLERWD